MIDPIYLYLFGPPVAALVFVGLISLMNRRSTAAFDRRVDEHRRNMRRLIDQ